MKIVEDFVDDFINIFLKKLEEHLLHLSHNPPWDPHILPTTVINKRWHSISNIGSRIGKGKNPVVDKKGSARMIFLRIRKVH